jgi:eukaryotic-like serine/threonine-protein kinase
MKPERWRQIDQLLEAALERQPEERAAFLAAAYEGDESLRLEVESLLRSDEAAETFIEEPATALVAEVIAERQIQVMAGQRISHYQILSRLGSGGMGEVYLAEDLKLARKVAIKFLSPALMEDEQARKRLLREARAAAALDHPNICTIHEVGDEAGRSFIIMQYIEGETLSERIKRERLNLSEALDIAIQVAEALQEAHLQRIIHRDIKPQNIMLTARGQVKVLDFGLAKVVRDRVVTSEDVDTSSLMSTPGTIIGTVQYMSPEQARCETLDVRSDIFSFGTTLYEMLSGRRPFEAKSTAEIISAILTWEPAPLERAGAPEELERIVRRCLEKDLERRYQTAQEVIIDFGNARREMESEQAGASSTAKMVKKVSASAGPLRKSTLQVSTQTEPSEPTPRGTLLAVAALLAVLLAAALGLNLGRLRERLSGGTAASAETIRLAVLPFENLTGDPEQEYFSDGLTEEMIAQLGRLNPQRLAVIARTSSMAYKKSGKTIDQIGSELRADYILEGSARREAGRIHISARLIRAHDQTQVWVDSYERERQDILVLQAEVARAIARQIRVQLSQQEQTRMSRSTAVDPEAYEAYLKGQFHMSKFSPPDTNTALEYFNLAIKKDPEFALGYAGIAVIWVQRQSMGVVSPKEAGPRATEAVTRALELDSTEEGVQLASGQVSGWVQWDWAASEAAFRRALDLNASLAEAHSRYAHLLQRLKRPGEAMAHIERAIELDPHNSQLQASYCQNLIFVGRYDDAIAQCRKALETAPKSMTAHTGLHAAYYHKGMYPQALEHWKAFFDSSGQREAVEALDRGYAEAGYARAMALAAEKLVARSRTAYVAPFNIAALYANAGKTDEALAWLEKAYDAHDSNMPAIHMVPTFINLRSEPRFRELLRRMNLPQI